MGDTWGDSWGGDLAFALLLEFQPQCDYILFHTHLATVPGWLESVLNACFLGHELRMLSMTC